VGKPFGGRGSGELAALPQISYLVGMEQAAPPQEPHPRSRPFGPPTLALRASLLASPNPFTKIRLCSELNLFTPLLIIPYIMLYCIIIVNPNSFRPYHTTLGPAAGPTCSKILAPPLHTHSGLAALCRYSADRQTDTRQTRLTNRPDTRTASRFASTKL